MQKVIQLKFIKGTSKRKPAGEVRVVGFIADDAKFAAEYIVRGICYELRYCRDPVYSEAEKKEVSYLCVCSFSIELESMTFEEAKQEIKVLFTKLKKRQQR